MNLTLNEAERALLVELLEGDLQALRSEIYRAETHAAKDLLKEREGIVKQLLERLRSLG